MKIDRVTQRLLVRGKSLPLPADGDEASQADGAFDAVARAIMREFSQRPPLPARQFDHDALLTVTYDLMLHLVRHDQVSVIRRRAETRGGYTRGGAPRINIFQKLSFALCAHNKELFLPRDRERIGKSLWFAYRHCVPSEFLVGFLRVQRGKNFLKRAASTIDNNFHHRIIKQLLFPQKCFVLVGDYDLDLKITCAKFYNILRKFQYLSDQFIPINSAITEFNENNGERIPQMKFEEAFSIINESEGEWESEYKLESVVNYLNIEGIIVE